MKVLFDENDKGKFRKVGNDTYRFSVETEPGMVIKGWRYNRAVNRVIPPSYVGSNGIRYYSVTIESWIEEKILALVEAEVEARSVK